MISASSLLGAAGEHFVMCQLLRHRLIAALAPAGVPNCDIVVSDGIGDRMSSVQVKTRRDLGSDGGWHMSKKHEQLRSIGLFYCFVDFGTSETAVPVTYIVPAAIVAETLEASHRAWLAQLGARGQARKDSDFRRFLPDYGKLGLADRSADWLAPYRDAWTMLSSPNASS